MQYASVRVAVDHGGLVLVYILRHRLFVPCRAHTNFTFILESRTLKRAAMVKGSVFNVIKEQLTCLSPPLQSDLTNKVVMVTGANTGIGLEAAKIFAGLHPKKLIVACRSEEKGKAAIAGE